MLNYRKIFPLNGGSFAEGMSVAALNNLVISKLGDMKDENGKSLFSAAELRWISATVGATVSSAVGGNAGQGAGIADSATKNNWLTHEQQQKMTEKLSKATTPEERQAILKEYYELSEQNILADSSQQEHIEPETITGLETPKKLGDAGVYFIVEENQGMHNNLKAAVDFYNIYNVVKHGPDIFKNVVFGTAAVVAAPVAVVSGAITYGNTTYTLYKDFEASDGDAEQFGQNVAMEGGKSFMMWGIDKITGSRYSVITTVINGVLSVYVDKNLKK